MDQIEKAEYRNSVGCVCVCVRVCGGLSFSLFVCAYVQEEYILILSLSLSLSFSCSPLSLYAHTHTRVSVCVQEDQVLISRLWLLRFLNFVNPGPIDHSAFVCQHGL